MKIDDSIGQPPVTELEGAAIKVLMDRIASTGAAVMVINAHDHDTESLKGAVVLINGEAATTAIVAMIVQMFGGVQAKNAVVH